MTQAEELGWRSRRDSSRQHSRGALKVRDSGRGDSVTFPDASAAGCVMSVLHLPQLSGALLLGCRPGSRAFERRGQGVGPPVSCTAVRGPVAGGAASLLA